MKIERLRELKNAQPFVPFRIHRTDGEPVEVFHRDSIQITLKGSCLLVSVPENGCVQIAASNVTRAEVIGFPAPEDLEFL